MAFPIIPALVSLGQSAYQYYQGAKQKRMADKLKPSNYTPPSVNEAITSKRKDVLSSTSPGYRRGLSRLRQSTAATIDAAKRIGGNASQIQQTVADTDAREKEIIKDLEVNNASFEAHQRDQLSNLLLAKGSYEQQSQEAFNAAKSALLGASERNKYNAVSNLAEGIVYSLPDSAIDGTMGTGMKPKGLGRLSPRKMQILMRKGLLPAQADYYGSMIS